MKIGQFNLHEVEGAVGERLEGVRQALLKACVQLETAGDQALAERLRPIRRRLEAYVAQVAIIGQVKAGKSSLVSAITRRPGLLPADVNPWTSVVTRLYFGHPSGETSGARFHFFDEAQWDRLATRGGRLGELTEGLLEDYKREQLFEQVSAMRERAKLRLSDKFEPLLGKTHRYETITKEIIERYVCAGDEPEERLRNPAAGRYNDITHTAEVYFTRDPFGCPICVMDTPGTNDPLLIREEITQQNLESADYFVVVLTAHQALSHSDLKLVRLLKALSRDRIVVFVNRIDEVPEITSKFENLRDHIQSRIQTEMGMDVPVVLGSAAWANYALLGNDADLNHDLLLKVAELKANQPGIEAAVGLSKAHQRSGAYLASGLSELEIELSRELFTGASRSILAAAQEDLLAIAQLAADQASFRLERIQRTDGGPSRLIDDDEHGVIMESIEGRVTGGITKLIGASHAKWDALERMLNERVDRFVEEQDKISAKGSSGTARAETLLTELDKLRDTLKRTYAETFNKIQDSLWLGLRALNKDKDSQVDPKARKQISSVRIGTLGVLGVEPKPDPIYRSIALDFSAGWLDSLFSRPDARLRSAIENVKKQFIEICAETVGQSRKEIDEQLEATVQNYMKDVRRTVDLLAGHGSGSLIGESDDSGREAVRAAARDQFETAGKVVSQLTELGDTYGIGQKGDDA